MEVFYELDVFLVVNHIFYQSKVVCIVVFFFVEWFSAFGVQAYCGYGHFSLEIVSGVSFTRFALRMKERNEQIKVERLNKYRKNIEVEPKLHKNTIVVIELSLFISFSLVIEIQSNNCKINKYLEQVSINIHPLSLFSCLFHIHDKIMKS